MKKKHLFCLFYLFPFFLFSQNVERILQTKDIHTIVNDDEFEGGKSLGVIVANENDNKIILVHAYLGEQYEIDLGNFSYITNVSRYQDQYGGVLQIGETLFYAPFKRVLIQDRKKVENSWEKIYRYESGAGISFILNVNETVIVFFVQENGFPGAMDINGKFYDNVATLELLKNYDLQKYNQSLKKAEQFGLKEKFLKCEVLVWGSTYYDTYKNLNKFMGTDTYGTQYEIQYDLSGYSYQLKNFPKPNIIICDDNGLKENISMVDFSKIIQHPVGNRRYNLVVGLGGNIYFYVTDNVETEVFRIRNTWDSTNLYALAINGYTEDFYGDYVKEVLLKMSKADLRLLRNTIFALYGVHFKSEDLNTYFDKQVWYTDKGLTSGEVTLPAHRQKLVEMIQKLEK